MRKLLALIKFIFALFFLIIGTSILLWVGYNEYIHETPGYVRPPLVGQFGLAPLMMFVGLYWARGAFNELIS